MRSVCLAMKMSLDGYVAGPNGELDWLFPSVDAELDREMTKWLENVDTILLGRVAYQEQAAFWPTQTSAMAALLNAHTKVVFSNTLTNLDWQNSRLAANVVTEVTHLRELEGRRIYASGGAQLAETLTEHHLVDEFRLDIHPVVLGRGKRLFSHAPARLGLRRVHATTYDSGAVRLIYAAVRAHFRRTPEVAVPTTARYWEKHRVPNPKVSPGPTAA